MKKKLALLISISTLVRAMAAALTELGNDEVYYRILALFPDTGYFDHPPMVAWLAGLTTLWSITTCEFLVRLGPIIIGSVNTWLLYILTRRLGGSERAGFAAALLCTGSIYMSVICGTFIMPDTPLTLFWIISLILLTDIFKNDDNRALILFGLTTGLAALSKYTGGELWLGTGIYILLFDRKWLKNPYLYLSALISIACFIPVVLWNVENNFITFTFHSARITSGTEFEAYLFFRELLGEVYYNNPIDWVLTLLAIIAMARGKKLAEYKWLKLFLCISLPMILIFLGVSLTRETLPHWSAPAYLTLMPFAALYLDSLRKLTWGYIASGLILVTLVIGIIQVNFGIIDFPDRRGAWRLGSSDFSLDMYGWRQGGEKFDSLLKMDTLMPADAPIIQYGWDDAAHIDCYFALPYGHNVKTLGNLESIHYWDWITKKRGGLHPGDDVWLITSSRYPILPKVYYKEDFETIMPADTLKIYRSNQHVMNFYVYRLINLKSTSDKSGITVNP